MSNYVWNRVICQKEIMDQFFVDTDPLGDGTVSDPEDAKNELLGKAVTDAKEKASVLTQAAGVELMAIQSIDYSWSQVNFEVQPMNRMLMADECLAAPMVAESASYDMDIEPDDIEVSDTVTVIWEIR